MAVVASLKKYQLKARQQALLSELNARFEVAKEAKRHFDTEVKLNLAFLVGQQWLTTNRVNPHQLVDLRAGDPPWRVRHVSNRIIAVYSRVLGALMRFPLTPEAAHLDKDQESRMAAEAAAHLAKSLWERRGANANVKRLLPQFFSWLLVAGTSYIAWWYDDEAEVEGPDGRTVKGDVRFGVPDPRQVFPDPGATSFDSASWFFRETVMPVSAVRARWPEYADVIEDMTLDVEPSLPSASLFQKHAPNFLKPSTVKGVNVVREYFERPSKEHRRGRYVVTANKNGVAVVDTELPFGDILMRKADFIPIPGAYFGRSLISDLRGPQAMRNELQSKALEHARMLLFSKLMMPVECELEEGGTKWTTLSGEIVRYSESTAGVRPWVFTPPGIPPYYNQELIRLDYDMQEIASQHASGVPMRGQVRRTALEARLQQEQDDMSRIAMYEGVNEALSEAITGAIKLCRERWDETRLVRVGSGDAARVMALSKADLDGAFQITLRIDPSLPFSKSERLELAFGLFDRGVFGQKGTPKAAREFLRFTDIDWKVGAVREDDLDRQVATFENEVMKEYGQYVEPGEFDDPEAHLEEHLPYLKRWRLEPNADYTRIRLLEDHCLKHQQRLQDGQGGTKPVLPGGVPGIEEVIGDVSGGEQPEQQPPLGSGVQGQGVVADGGTL